MEPIRLPLVDGYQLQISCGASYLTIEGEELSSGRTFSLKLDSDAVAQLKTGLFQDIHAMYRGLIEAVNKTHPGVDVTIQPGGKMKYIAIFSAGVIKKEYSFSLDLEEKALEPNGSLEIKVNVLKGEINRLKIEHGQSEQKVNLLKNEIEMMKKENEKANLLIRELTKDKAEQIQQINLLKNELDRVKTENETRYNELARQMLRLEEKVFQGIDGAAKDPKPSYKSLFSLAKIPKLDPVETVYFNPSSKNASHFIFSDDKRTISKKGSTGWSCLECLPQVPSKGQHRYSIKITNGEGWLFGITDSRTRDNWNVQSGYRISTKDGIVYCSYNGQQPRVPGPYGQINSVITMIVDMDKGNLILFVDNKKVNSLKFPTDKAYHAYVSSSDHGDSVTIVQPPLLDI